MPDGVFEFENCLLKHHVRTKGWLPLCKCRREQINAGVKEKNKRRVRYFTFCAVGAIDVLMLDVAKVLVKSRADTFDTVCFFDRDRQRVVDTQKRIPGAIGFVGDFIDTVLLEDPETIEEEATQGDENNDPLSIPESDNDTAATRETQRRLAERRAFIKKFPFDIVNLDLEEFLFKPSDPMPGKVINAMRRLFRWQRRLMYPSKGQKKPLDGFSLMFTTQIGPPNLTDDYLSMLRNELTTNLDGNTQLAPMLVQRGGDADIAKLEITNFNLFFKLGMPKVIARTLLEADWYIDPDVGINLYEFERTSKDGPYKMLHLVTDVKRQRPPNNLRTPNSIAPTAQEAYARVVAALFENHEILVSDSTIDKNTLQADLEKIKARRKKYYPDE
jgi:hypothetical protein